MDGDAGLPTTGLSLREAVEDAHVPTLAVMLVHLTGEARWIEGEAPAYLPFGDDQGGLSEAFRKTVRAEAAAALERLAEGASLPPPPDASRVRRMMNYIAGAEIPERYADFLAEELGVDGVDRKKPDWSAPELREAASRLKVVIIGAGMSGLLAAIRLKQAGVEFEIVEKNADVGGTWLENVYPGVRVDTPNHLYSYSFEPNHVWPYRYSTGEVLLGYFQATARKYGLYEAIRFNAEVTGCLWDEGAGLWRVEVKTGDGGTEALTANAVVSAVGQLNKPKLPDIEGRDAFKGESFHSARWPKGLSLKGKRVAVIGTGASAFQFVPEIAGEAASVAVYQRTPPWLAPAADYHDPVGEGKKRLLEAAPFYDRWYRFFLFWTLTDGVYEAVKADADWAGGPNAVGALNAELGGLLLEALKPQTEGRPDLQALVSPAYPFGGKRALRDNGVWVSALRRDTVELVSAPIVRIREEGVETLDGRLREADVLVYGTGFYASEFLKGVKVVGRDGRELHEVWKGDPRAYLGILAPGFPNFFSVYGPNTNIVVNGSIIFFSECAVRYILGCLEIMARRGVDALEVKPSVHDAFNAKVDAANALMAWGAPQVSSWYKSETGRVSQNWPFPLVDYWSATLKPDPADLSLRRLPAS